MYMAGVALTNTCLSLMLYIVLFFHYIIALLDFAQSDV